MIYLSFIVNGLVFGDSYCNFTLSKSLNCDKDFMLPVCDVDFNKINLYENDYIIATSNNNEECHFEEFIFDIVNIDNLVNVMTILFVLCSSVICSLVFVSNYIYSSMINQFVDKYNTNKELYEFDPYLFEYLDEFKKMKNSVLSVDFLNSLKCKFLKHNTPKGEIIMNYNHLSCNFDYYCKKVNFFDFNYLDVVSRIYVVKNNCKNIYIDKYENYDYGLDYDNDNDGDGDGDGDIDGDGNIAVLEKEEKECCIFYNKLNKNDKSNETVEYVSNKYKYKGTIEDFYIYCETNKYKIHYADLLENSSTNNCITFSIDKEEENTNTNTNTNIGFKEFKKFQKF